MFCVAFSFLFRFPYILSLIRSYGHLRSSSSSLALILSSFTSFFSSRSKRIHRSQHPFLSYTFTELEPKTGLGHWLASKNCCHIVVHAVTGWNLASHPPVVIGVVTKQLCEQLGAEKAAAKWSGGHCGGIAMHTYTVEGGLAGCLGKLDKHT